MQKYYPWLLQFLAKLFLKPQLSAGCRITGLRGVIVQKSVEEHYLEEADIKQTKKCKCDIEPEKECDDAEYWTLHTELISSNCTEVPWYLDDGTNCVHVVGARDATNFVLPKEALHLKSRIIGIKRIEWVLPVGTKLTVVGEACRDDDGTIRIQQPPNGPFYVSRKKINKHIEDFGNCARLYKHMSVGLMMLGACLLATSGICYNMEWNRRLQ